MTSSDTSLPTTRGARPPTLGRHRDARRYGAGFWAIALAFLTAMAFSTVPTPLYPIYQARDGFSTFMVTIVFTVYAVGVLTSLLLAGHISDRVGRKKVLIPALILELVAAVLFLADPALPILIAARLVTGLGVGMITATATAYLQELHTAHRPGASSQRFEIVSTAVNIGGLGIGPLVAGFLAQYVEAPLRLPYIVFIALLLISIGAVALTSETVERTTPLPAYRPQRVSIDHGDRRGFVAAAVAAVASFAVFGLFTSVVPGFVSGTLHQPSRALAGLVVFSMFGAAAVAQTTTVGIDPRSRRTIGLLALAVGVVLLAIGDHTASLPGFLIGGIAAGAGAGLLFKAAVGAVAAMAPRAERGEALASLFLFAYAGLIVPVIGLGVALEHTAATTAMTWFTGILLALLVTVGVLARRSRAVETPSRVRRHGPPATGRRGPGGTGQHPEPLAASSDAPHIGSRDANRRGGRRAGTRDPA